MIEDIIEIMVLRGMLGFMLGFLFCYALIAPTLSQVLERINEIEQHEEKENGGG